MTKPSPEGRGHTQLSSGCKYIAHTVLVFNPESRCLYINFPCVQCASSQAPGINLQSCNFSSFGGRGNLTFWAVVARISFQGNSRRHLAQLNTAPGKSLLGMILIPRVDRDYSQSFQLRCLLTDYKKYMPNPEQRLPFYRSNLKCWKCLMNIRSPVPPHWSSTEELGHTCGFVTPKCISWLLTLIMVFTSAKKNYKAIFIQFEST